MESRTWRWLIVANLIVTVVLAVWVVLFATGNDSLLPPALDPSSETVEARDSSNGTPISEWSP